MTQRRRNRHRKRRVGRRAFLIGLGGSVSAALTYYLLRSIPAGNNAEPAPSPQAAPNPALPSGEWRAVWVSYLEFAEMDFSSESAFRADAAALMDNCLSLGLNEAHARGLSLEAWVNPYRLRSSASMPPVLAENSLLNTHPEWVCTVNEGAYLNPAIPEAADYVVQGVAELVQNYAVDGIHFDDYFYPTTDPSIDAAQFAASGEADLTAWRRANVTRLVKAAHDAVKAADPTLRFGVSPQGNPDNDRNEQYTDLSVWLTASGADAVVDYLCPQIYWGYGYTLSSGSTRFAFENITAEWLALPRAESTALYFGLGAYRVGVGDGGANADSVSQWCSGSALARQVTDLRSAGAGGWALYRYGSLFRSDESGLAAAERAALTALNG